MFAFARPNNCNARLSFYLRYIILALSEYNETHLSATTFELWATLINSWKIYHTGIFAKISAILRELYSTVVRLFTININLIIFVTPNNDQRHTRDL